jgi:hypothetical protein
MRGWRAIVVVQTPPASRFGTGVPVFARPVSSLTIRQGAPALAQWVCGCNDY